MRASDTRRILRPRGAELVSLSRMKSLSSFRFALSLTTVGAALLACSSGDAGTVGAEGGSVAKAAAAASASYRERCVSGVRTGDSDEVNTDAQEIESAPGVTPAYKSQAIACYRSIAADCSGTSAACDQISMLTGTLAIGAPCRRDYQCSSGACSVSSVSRGNVCGACVAAIADGADCSSGSIGSSQTRPDCGPGSRCTSNGTSTQTTYTCQKQLRGLPAGSTCNEASRCGSGTKCVYGASPSTSGLCTALAAPGASCAEVGCDQGGSYGCDRVSKLCVLLPKAGESCAGRPCSHGLVCDAGNKVCRAPSTVTTVGGACSSGDSCTPGFCRQTSTNGVASVGACEAFRPSGSACGGTLSSACQDGFTCIDPINSNGAGTCAKRVTAVDCK